METSSRCRPNVRLIHLRDSNDLVMHRKHSSPSAHSPSPKHSLHSARASAGGAGGANVEQVTPQVQAPAASRSAWQWSGVHQGWPRRSQPHWGWAHTEQTPAPSGDGEGGGAGGGAGSGDGDSGGDGGNSKHCGQFPHLIQLHFFSHGLRKEAAVGRRAGGFVARGRRRACRSPRTTTCTRARAATVAAAATVPAAATAAAAAFALELGAPSAPGSLSRSVCARFKTLTQLQKTLLYISTAAAENSA